MRFPSRWKGISCLDNSRSRHSISVLQFDALSIVICPICKSVKNMEFSEMRWKATLCSMLFSFKISKNMWPRCLPLWLTSTNRKAIIHTASTISPSALRSIKWAVTALKPSRFGLLHMSVVREIRPRAFYNMAVNIWTSYQLAKLTHLHPLFLLSITLFILLKDKLCCLRPMWYILIFNISSPNIGE